MRRLDDLAWLLLLFLVAPAPGRASPPSPLPLPRGRVLTIEDLRALASSVGFPDPDLAAAVAMAESHGDPDAKNIVTKPAPGNLPERSWGLWQVNTLAHPEFDESRLLDPVYNANAALLISRQGTNFNPWSAFTKGLYKKYLPGA